MSQPQVTFVHESHDASFKPSLDAPPAGASPRSKGLQKRSGRDPSTAHNLPCIQGSPKTLRFPECTCCSQPTCLCLCQSFYLECPSQLSRSRPWGGMELSCLMSHCASVRAPLALRQALSRPCSSGPGLAQSPSWMPSDQPRAPHASLSNK